MTKRISRILDANQISLTELIAQSPEAMVALSYVTINNVDIVQVEAEAALVEYVPTVVTNTLTAEIRALLLDSTQVQADIAKLRSYNRLEYNCNAQIVEDFMINDYYDRDIERYLTNMVEDEKHNHISAMSYILPSYSLDSKVQYFVEKAKIALASTIIHAYITLHGARSEDKRKWVGNRRVFITIQYIGDPDKELLVKNELKGLHFVPSEAPMAKRIKGKAGLRGKKLPAKFVTLCKDFASLPHALVTDITDEQLLSYMLQGKEMLAILNGEFLTKGRKYSKLERKALIQERVDETTTRYEMYIASVNTLRTGAARFNSPIYHSVHFEYRGRMNYDNTNMLLNPQSKIGKFMWEAYSPRILTTLDYKWLVFAVVSGVTRSNPNETIAMFEANEAKWLEDYLVEDDMLELTYRRRIVQAISDYRSGTPNSTYTHKDYTNGGAIHFVSGLTREPKAMGAVNLLDISSVNDPHASLQKAFNAHTGLHATRDDIKKAVSQGITAGVSPKSAIKKIEEFFLAEHNEEVEISETMYNETVYDVYGRTGALFHEFNKWGNELIDNETSVLYFKTKDGFPSMSISYIKSQEVRAYFVSTTLRKNDNLPLITLHRNMPMYYVRSGKWMQPALEGKFAVAKVSGFLANVTHGMLDAVANRSHMRIFCDMLRSGLLIHDNIVTDGDTQEHILGGAKQDILGNFETLPFEDAAIQAAQGRKAFPHSKFVLSDSTTFNLGDNFLQA